ncbi:MAG: Na+/H+ antiporter NhaA, partial [Naasia sp.]
AVPVFAFFAAGVAIGGADGLRESLTDPVAIGIIVALVVGKSAGISGTALLVTRIRSLNLHPSLRWGDIVGVSFVAGIGFTVSLLIGDLAFGEGTAGGAHVKIGVLVGSLLSAIIGGTILAVRGRRAVSADPPLG